MFDAVLRCEVRPARSRPPLWVSGTVRGCPVRARRCRAVFPASARSRVSALPSTSFWVRIGDAVLPPRAACALPDGLPAAPGSVPISASGLASDEPSRSIEVNGWCAPESLRSARGHFCGRGVPTAAPRAAVARCAALSARPGVSGGLRSSGRPGSACGRSRRRERCAGSRGRSRRPRRGEPGGRR